MINHNHFHESVVCNLCYGDRYLIQAQGPMAEAYQCNSCFQSCSRCNDTGFLLSTDKQGREQAIDCVCKDLKRKITLFNQANIPRTYFDATLDNFQKIDSLPYLKDALAKARSILENYSNNRRTKLHNNALSILQNGISHQQDFQPGMLFHGSIGTGKTRLVCGMIREYIFRYGISCRFVEFTKLLSEIKSGYDNGISENVQLEPFNQIEVLVIDELGKGRKTDWENQILDSIILQRYNTESITIFTTNYTDSLKTTYEERYHIRASGDNSKEKVIRETLQQRLQPRIYSRLKAMCEFCDMSGSDFRQLTPGSYEM